VPAQALQDLLYGEESLTLRELLRRAPSLSTEPIPAELLDQPLDRLLVSPVEVTAEQPLYRPPGLGVAPASDSAAMGEQPPPLPERARPPAPQAEEGTRSGPALAPTRLDDSTAVRLSYSVEIEQVASFLRTGLSALVYCDKLVVEHLWRPIASQADLGAVLLEVPEEDEGGLMPRGLRQRQLAALRKLMRDLKQGDVLIIPHLDLLAGGSEANLSGEARELTELLYSASDRLLLAFSDRSVVIPEVLAARFAVRAMVVGVPRVVSHNGEPRLLGDALVTAEEAAYFTDYTAEGLYKNVSGMNPVRLRQAIAYAVEEHAAGGGAPVPVDRLIQAIRAFKAQTSANFEVPNVSFADIGGYEDVKAELGRALSLMTGSYNLPEGLQRELIPRGFIFHGPPGTGKTLFAKAISNQLNATIQVVSGPEITDMYVGESERKVRELFAEARRNAPAVLVFDEFDSIATKRSGRDDGGSRAGNAIVAQILTEMDGFRPDVPMLVIGTTNRLDIIDEALLRPSRFQAVGIGLPSVTARRSIAEVHSRHFRVQVAPELLDVIAAATDGLNGDEIRSLFRDACVGLYCQDPPVPVDARRLGWLVGRIRQSLEQRAVGKSAAAAPRRGERPGPSGPMTSLTDRSAAQSPAPAAPLLPVEIVEDTP
jgi:transitional endoplasmic reticulum ATPase